MVPTHPVFECRTLPAFTSAFLRLPEIRVYFLLCFAAAIAAAMLESDVAAIAIPVLAVVLGYPAFEYALHRLLLHGTYLCKTEMTARIWWRIHYRHHAEPRDQDVIMAAPWTLVVAVVAGALLASSLWWSWAGFAAALSASFLAAIVYEYFHSLAHGRVHLPEGYLLRMRHHHTAHHYRDERGNYGIVTPVIDGLLRTVLPSEPIRSPTVHNLGYRDEMTVTYPYILRLERERGNGLGPAASDASS